MWRSRWSGPRRPLLLSGAGRSGRGARAGAQGGFAGNTPGAAAFPVTNPGGLSVQFVSRMLVRCIQQLSASFSSLCSPSSPFLLPVLPLGWVGMQKTGFEERAQKLGAGNTGRRKYRVQGNKRPGKIFTPVSLNPASHPNCIWDPSVPAPGAPLPGQLFHLGG